MSSSRRIDVEVGMGSHEAPFPTSTSSPASTIHGRGLADSLYSRGEWGEDAEGGPLWSPVRCLVAATILYNPGKEEKCKLDSLGELI